MTKTAPRKQKPQLTRTQITSAVVATLIDAALIGIGLLGSAPIRDYCIANGGEMMPFYLFNGGIILLMFISTALVIRIMNK